MKKLARIVCVVLLAVLLATLPGMLGCGQKEAGVPEVTYGFLWDFTGRAAQGVKEFYNGMMDYLRKTEEEDPIVGAKLKVVTFDSKSDTSRIPTGYLWLKGKGATMMTAAPQDTELLRSRFEADQIPFFCGSEMISLRDSEWAFFIYSPVEHQTEMLMHWVMDTWDYSKGQPKIGFVTLAGVPFYKAQLDMAQAIYQANPGKFASFKVEQAPSTTTIWAIEASRLMDSDFIIPAMSGPPLAAFTKEARSRGYKNKLIAPFESYWSYWNLVKGAVPADMLDGIVSSSYMPLWDDDVPFISEVRQYTLEYRPNEAEALFQTSGEITGWATGMILVDVARRAVEKAQGGEIDGPILRDVLEETDMTVAGFGNPWKVNLAENINSFVQTIKLCQYRATEDKWVTIADWKRPPTLGG
ncbi:MAG: hypothetical protein A2Y91_07845 [Chloroflexi bacterium RBG_13_54_8]|nr:MAG: hypothetical protein A2Y91_07845 [Chloroflexi bacterium RBG_13_54_8]